MACEDVPLRWRRMFAITHVPLRARGRGQGAHLGGRALVRAVVHIHASVNRRTGVVVATKTESTRRVPVELTLLPLLKAMHKEAGGVGRVSPVEATDKKLSRQLQRCRSRGDGPFANDASRDLRATGITWSAVRGDEPLREAENLRDTAFGTPFPPLPDAVRASNQPQVSATMVDAIATSSNRRYDPTGLRCVPNGNAGLPSHRPGIDRMWRLGTSIAAIGYALSVDHRSVR